MLTASKCVCTDWGFFSSLCSRQHNHGYLVKHCTLDPLLTVCVLKLLAHSLLLLGYWNHQSVLSAGPTHAVKWQLHQKFPLASKKKNYSCGVTTGKWSVPAIHLCLPLPPPPWACLRSPAAVFASSTTQVCFRLPSCLISATFFKAVGYLGNSRSSIT